MYGLSTADGFLNVKEGLDEMIKYLANEPSVGLYFVQQHAQASMPHLLTLKDEVVEKIHEVGLLTEDMEDSIDVVRSMPECGLPIMDHMIKDINNSLLLMSTSLPKRGLITSRSEVFPTSRSNSNPQETFGNNASSSLQASGSSRGYLSAVFSSAKQKATGLRWSQANLPPSADPASQGVEFDTLTTAGDAEADELPLSSKLVDDQLNSETLLTATSIESYDKFKSDREAKLEAWLQES